MANAISVILRSRKSGRPSAANLIHNSGLKAASYWLKKDPELYQTFRPKNTRNANEIWRNWIKEIEENYQQKRNRKLRNDAIRIEEGLLVVGKDVQDRDDPAKVWEFAQNFLHDFEQKYGGKVLHFAVHNHEGKSAKEPNIHVHFLYSNFDDRAQNVRSKKITKKELSNLQTTAWQIGRNHFPGLERARHYEVEGKKAPRQKHHRQYREEKEKEAAAEQAIAKARVSDLKAETAKLRAELQKAKAQRAQYAAMEQANRELRERIKARELSIEDLRRQMEQLRGDLLHQIAAEKEKAAEAKKEKEAAERRAKAAIGKAERLRKRAAEAEEKAKKAAERAEAAEAKIEELMDKLEWQSSQLDNWASKLTEAEDKLDEAQRRAWKAETRAERAEVRAEAAEAKIEEQQRIIKRLVSYIEHWVQKLGVTIVKGMGDNKIAAAIDARIDSLVSRERPPQAEPRPKLYDDDEELDGPGWGRGPGM